MDHERDDKQGERPVRSSGDAPDISGVFPGVYQECGPDPVVTYGLIVVDPSEIGPPLIPLPLPALCPSAQTLGWGC